MPLDLDKLEELEKKATMVADAKLERYPRSGGRLWIPEGDGACTLIADFYEEGDREFFFALRNASSQLIALARLAVEASEKSSVMDFDWLARYDALAKQEAKP